MTSHLRLIQPTDQGMGDQTDQLMRDHTRYLRARNLRPSTIYQRGRVLARLRRQVTPDGLLNLTDEQILDALDARNVTAATRACELAHLSSFYEWALLTGRTELDPTVSIPRPKVPRRLPRPMPTEDMLRALDQAPDRVRPILVFAAFAGLRACEIAQLRTEHVLAHEDPPIIVIEVGKGGSPSTVAAHPAVVEVVRGRSAGWVVERRDGLRGPCRPWRISSLANEFLHSIDIGHTLHTLRHWFGTQLYHASERDLRTTQEGMRHLSPASTADYTWLSPGDVAAAVEAVPDPRRQAA